MPRGKQPSLTARRGRGSTCEPITTARSARHTPSSPPSRAESVCRGQTSSSSMAKLPIAHCLRPACVSKTTLSPPGARSVLLATIHPRRERFRSIQTTSWPRRQLPRGSSKHQGWFLVLGAVLEPMPLAAATEHCTCTAVHAPYVPGVWMRPDERVGDVGARSGAGAWFSELEPEPSPRLVELPQELDRIATGRPRKSCL